MSDDRFWNIADGNITFREYIAKVVNNQPERSDDLRALIILYGKETIDQIMQGKRIVEAKDFLSNNKREMSNG